MLFLKEEKQKMRGAQSNKSAAEINKELGIRWQQMTREEQKKFYDKCAEMRQLYLLEHPDWDKRNE